ncbi:hypothetical protein CTI12_AA557230 [Artemisia annua]|uniref:DUF4216 domain-containing protein n=1 Tax=Artemisia annua TaxID=35608 RepID=A0A2U1KQD9_ARTAN|nr:hypothetical protein CTI12_AA557230 [Artemisia annua]
MQAVVWFILNNSPEIDADIQAYKDEFPNNTVETSFPPWFNHRIREKSVAKDPSCSPELLSLACGPSSSASTYPACIVNGVKFMVHERDILHTTQGSGVSTPGPDGDMYYGQLEEILELTYMGNRKVVLFRCKWFDTHNPSNPTARSRRSYTERGIHHILTDKDAFRNQQYILATQATQVFYLEDPARRPPHWKVVEDVHHRKIWHRDLVESDQDPSFTLPGYCAGNMVTGETSNRALRKAFRDNKNQPLPIGFDYDDQKTFSAIGKYQAQFNSLVGEQVRPLPLDCNWEQIPDVYKAHIFPALQTYFDLAPWLNDNRQVRYGNNAFTVGERVSTGLKLQMRSLYRKNKNRIKARWFDIHSTPAVAREHPPPPDAWVNRTREEWELLVDWWSDPARMERSAKNAENRSKNTILTHQGRTSFVQGRNNYRVDHNGENEDLVETWRKGHSSNGKFKTSKNETSYREMKSLFDQVKAGTAPSMTEEEILDRVVPSNSRQNMSGRGRRMTGTGKASSSSTHQPFEQDYITRQHMTEVLRREQQEKELFRKQTQEAQQRAIVAEQEARSANSRLGTMESFFGQFLAHYNSQGNPFNVPFPPPNPFNVPFPPPNPAAFSGPFPGPNPFLGPPAPQAPIPDPNNPFTNCYRPTFPNSTTCPGSSYKYVGFGRFFPIKSVCFIINAYLA